MVFFSFSKKTLSLDFLSRLLATNIIDKSSIFFETISSIILENLSLTLFTIISFSFSKKDLLSKFSLKFSIFLRISASS